MSSTKEQTWNTFLDAVDAWWGLDSKAWRDERTPEAKRALADAAGHYSCIRVDRHTKATFDICHHIAERLGSLKVAEAIRKRSSAMVFPDPDLSNNGRAPLPLVVAPQAPTEVRASVPPFESEARRSLERLRKRVGGALDRIRDGLGAMRIPAEPTDPDLVIVDLFAEIERMVGVAGTMTNERDTWRRIVENSHDGHVALVVLLKNTETKVRELERENAQLRSEMRR